MRSKEQQIRAAEAKYLIRTPSGYDVIIWDHAEGATVWDVNGKDYIDLTSGVVVTSVGHSHPRVAEAVSEQVRRLLNCADAPHPLRGRLAQKLIELAGPPFDVVSFQNSGSEGIEVALKAARAFTGKSEVLCFSGGYHGKTLGSLSVTQIPELRQHVGPLVPGTLVSPYAYCYRCPLSLTYPSCDVACADKAWEIERDQGTDSLAAVIVEPLLGVSGAVVPPPEFWTKIRSFADERGAVLIFDEVQAAFGRSGYRWFAFQRLGVTPDIVAAGKGIAAGIPITAAIGRREIFEAAPASGFRSTYGGNPVSCAAALATIDVIETEGLVERSGRLGDAILAQLRSWIGEVPGIGDARGLGMNLGIEVVKDVNSRTPDSESAFAAHRRAAELGVLVLPPTGPHSNVLRLAPPLVIPEDQLWDGLRRLRQAFEDTAL